MKQIKHREIKYSYRDVPTLQKFADCDAFIRAIMGPVGSGKSSACCIEIFTRSCKQKPDNNGFRRTRWVVIRNTYRQLNDTTIKTFLGDDNSYDGWFPPGLFGNYLKSEHIYTMSFTLPDNTHVISEILFRALDKPEHVRNLLSMDLTGAWLNEHREIPEAVFNMIQNRVGRYPPMRYGGPTWFGIIMDTNPPDTDHWHYKLFEKERPANAVLFRQPSGRGPNAENLSNLPPNYYQNISAGKSEDYCRVYIDGEYGYVQEGKPVYPAYKDSIHLSQKYLTAIPGIPIRLGWDFGLTPACVITQLTPRGQLLVLREYVSTDMGIRRLATEIVRPALRNEFFKNPVISTGDLAGNQRAQTDERTCFQELKDAGIPSTMAKTNDYVARIGAVEAFLTRHTEAGPGLLLDPRCEMLRQGFLGKYKYRRIQMAGDNKYIEKPEKNIYSHPHDALQYAAMDAEMGIKQIEINRRALYNSKPKFVPPASAWT